MCPGVSAKADLYRSKVSFKLIRSSCLIVLPRDDLVKVSLNCLLLVIGVRNGLAVALDGRIGVTGTKDSVKLRSTVASA